MAHHLYRHMLLCLCAALLSCGVVSDDCCSADAYTSDHFTIYYSVIDYSFPEIERIAERKERLLARINGLLQVEFDGMIEAHLEASPCYYGYAYYDGHTEESRGYVMEDDGHEIVHIVSYAALGYSQSRFMTEGLAVFIELDFEYQNAIEQFVEEYGCVSLDRGGPAQQLASGNFPGCYFDYVQAGAFVCYLAQEYGVDSLKAFYRQSCSYTGTWLEQAFEQTFGRTVWQVEQAFCDRYMPERMSCPF